jgi:hypothetical protein
MHCWNHCHSILQIEWQSNLHIENGRLYIVHEVLEKYGHLLDDSTRNLDYNKLVDDGTPLRMCHSDEGDIDDCIINYLAGKESMSWDIDETLDEFCNRIGFYERYPEYIGKIF